VDLDGTLIYTDMLHESTLRLLCEQPIATVLIPVWLARGKAALKRAISDRVDVDVSLLPYNRPLIEWLTKQRAAGRRLVLCTASDGKFANAVASHIGIFDEVLFSNGQRNLAGSHKADALVERFGERGFDYVGNASADLAVWQHARRAVVVSGNDALRRAAQRSCTLECGFDAPARGLPAWLRMLRMHQWLKNALLAVPLLAAHQLENVDAWRSVLLAFLSFSICASAVYIANDLLDLESDRRHPRKRNRPFASGAMPLALGASLVPLLLVTSIALAWFVNAQFLGSLLAYLAITTMYSLGLKRIVLLDCLLLATLYTLRIVAGSAAANLGLSFWLLAFSIFLFLSLAFVKRYAELLLHAQSGSAKTSGRGYRTTDATLVQVMGIASGYGSVLVLALYLQSDAVVRLYATPQWMWGAVPVMLFWVSWIWLLAHRGEMHDDPMVFAVKDPPSLAAGAAFLIVLVLGTIDW
jgi:4-hydroxybenzoate polyprenyltransferase